MSTAEGGLPARRARFHHPHLFAADLDVTLAFYRRWFGAEVVADHSFAGSRNVMVMVGDGHINIYDQPPRDHGRNAVHHLGFQVDDLAGLVAEMGKAGIQLRSAVRELPELDYIMVEGPDGVLLELFEYKPGPPRPGLDRWFGW